MTGPGVEMVLSPGSVESIEIRVTVTGRLRPIVRPPTAATLRALTECAEVIDAIGPSLTDAMLALARIGGHRP